MSDDEGSGGENQPLIPRSSTLGSLPQQFFQWEEILLSKAMLTMCVATMLTNVIVELTQSFVEDICLPPMQLAVGNVADLEDQVVLIQHMQIIPTTNQTAVPLPGTIVLRWGAVTVEWLHFVCLTLALLLFTKVLRLVPMHDEPHEALADDESSSLPPSQQ